jgi:hypothetical protein
MSVSGAASLVDTDSDGDLDVPSVGYKNSDVPEGFLGEGVASIRVLGRSGVRSSHGAVVVVKTASTGAVVGSRVVGGGVAQYDVHFAVPVPGAVYDIEVMCPGGRRHSKASQVVLGAVQFSSQSSPTVPLVVVRDVPAITFVGLVPSSGIMGFNANVTVVVRALGGEPGLLPSRLSTVNGVNVTSSFVDAGNGTYWFVYRVGASDASVGVLPMSLSLVDAAAGVSSAVVTQVSNASAGVVSVDVRPPVVSYNATLSCSPVNGSVSGTANQTLCVSCGSVSEEPNGCVVWLRLNTTTAKNYTVDASNNMNVTLGPFRHGEVAVVYAYAVDTAGNVGPMLTWTWEVDLQSPVTIWTPQDPTPFTNSTSIDFSFGCTEVVSLATACMLACFDACVLARMLTAAGAVSSNVLLICCDGACAGVCRRACSTTRSSLARARAWATAPAAVAAALEP